MKRSHFRRVKVYMPPKDVENKLLRLANQPAPELELTSMEGAPTKLSEQKGKVILLDFYGTEKSSSYYFLRGVPQYIIVDKEGKVVFAHLGYSDEMEKVLDDLLGKHKQ